MIALSLAAAFPDAEVYASDVSEDALSLARENAAVLNLSERVRFIESDLFEHISERFDLIVANLPYVPETDRPNLSREVLQEPSSALFGGTNGEEVIRRLIVTAPPHLAPGGMLALEIGSARPTRSPRCSPNAITATFPRDRIMPV